MKLITPEQWKPTEFSSRKYPTLGVYETHRKGLVRMTKKWIKTSLQAGSLSCVPYAIFFSPSPPWSSLPRPFHLPTFPPQCFECFLLSWLASVKIVNPIRE